MKLNLKLLEDTKKQYNVKLYQSTIDKLLQLSYKYKVSQSDLVRHSINNTIDSLDKEHK